MRRVVLLSIPFVTGLCAGCPGPDLADFRGFEETADAWGLGLEDARGVCLFDADGDGDLDAFFTGRQDLRFYLNLSAGFFADTTDGAGLAGDLGESPAGCGAADLDGDGDRDLLVTFNRDDTRLFLNDGRAHFSDASAAFGLSGWGQSSVTFEDLDRDGRLDVLLAGAREGRTQLLANLGGTLQDRTPPELRAVEHSWGGALFDADNDDLPDLFLGTDGDERETGDLFLRNDGAFAFVPSDGIGNTVSAMGIAVADVDADGFLDLYVTNIGHHSLWHNDGAGGFVDLATATGVWGDRGETAGWGGFFLDVDDDGRLDLFKANGGFSLPLGTMDNFQRKDRERNQLFVPRRDVDPVLPGLSRFVDVAERLGLADEGSALGSAWADLDGDGRLDLVVANREGAPVRVYRNRGVEGGLDPGRLRLRLRPLGDEIDGLGARVHLEACGAVQEGLVTGGPSVFSQGETVVHFGLGGCTEDLAVRVRWPDGESQEWTIRSTQVDVYSGPIQLAQGEL